MCILARFPTERVMGSSLRQNLCPAPMAAVYLFHRHWRISIPSYRILCSKTKRSPSWELDSKIHAPETQRHLFLHWKKRLKRAGTSHPSCRIQTLCLLSASLPPQEAPPGTHLALHTGRDAATSDFQIDCALHQSTTSQGLPHSYDHLCCFS